MRGVPGKSLRPALRGVFPSRSAHRLRRRHRRSRRNRNPGRRLGSVYRCRHGGLRDLRYALFLFRQQWSHKPQRLHFFLQPRQFHLFLPQYFIDIFHSQGTRTLGRWFQILLSHSSRDTCIVKGFGGSGGAPGCTGAVAKYPSCARLCYLKSRRAAAQPRINSTATRIHL